MLSSVAKEAGVWLIGGESDSSLQNYLLAFEESSFLIEEKSAGDGRARRFRNLVES